jgi:glycogen(starch) synthase
MKVLMFGWEFPPHISGGLGTACYGLTRSLTNQGINILFVTPRAENHSPFRGAEVLSASQVPVGEPESVIHMKGEGRNKSSTISTSFVRTIAIEAQLHPYYSIDYHEDQLTSMEHWHYQPYEEGSSSFKQGPGKKNPYSFLGGYGPQLLTEIRRYATVAGEVAQGNNFDVIHAHDWMTYLAGIAAKQVSGKPLIVHVHATELDRSGRNGNTQIKEIERMGMTMSDHIIAVSQLTKDIIVSHYHIDPDKVSVVHNGVLPKRVEATAMLPSFKKRVITFLGRVTYQKGPEYFVDAAYLVHQKFPDVHFVMAGSGDMIPTIMEKVAALNLSSHFHFTGFLNSEKVDQIWTISDMYVMPSVSEPFGIAPLEAMMAGVPVIISNQSGVAEVVRHAIKVDFWNIKALANAMMSLLLHKSLVDTIKQNGTEEIKEINWDAAAKKVNKIYHDVTARI